MVLMDGPEAQVMKSLDSFWFFTNILSRKPQNFNIQGHDRASEGDEELLSKEDSKPISPTIPMCLKCGESEAMEVVESPSPSSAEKVITGGRRSKRRFKRCSKRREVLGELNLGSFKVGSDLYGNSPKNGGQNLPPLSVNGGVAMKEHLKSWAYAVACTVR